MIEVQDLKVFRVTASEEEWAETDRNQTIEGLQDLKVFLVSEVALVASVTSDSAKKGPTPAIIDKLTFLYLLDFFGQNGFNYNFDWLLFDWYKRKA